jgi:hypothetical protein
MGKFFWRVTRGHSRGLGWWISNAESLFALSRESALAPATALTLALARRERGKEMLTMKSFHPSRFQP